MLRSIPPAQTQATVGHVLKDTASSLRIGYTLYRGRIGSEHFLPRRKIKGSVEDGESPEAQAEGVRKRERSKDLILRTAGRCKVRSGKGCESTWAVPERPVEDGKSASGASCRRRNRGRLGAKAPARGRSKARLTQESARGAS